MTAKFGPAGNGDTFYAAGHQSTTEAPAWLEAMGLTAFEYQCGRGVRVSAALAGAMRREAEKHHIAISLHAPYYISLASAEEDKRLKSVDYILESAKAVAAMGGDRIVVHAGGLGGRSRAEATGLAMETLREAQLRLDEAGLSVVHICPETMGKINQLGDLDEVLTFCEMDERFLPCVDFGHMNSRTAGGMNSREAFAALLGLVAARLGEERAAAMHIHFSKIEYSAGGEKRHLTFEDTVFGPEPAPLMALIAERHWHPVVICESDGTQAEDALALKKMWETECQMLDTRY